MTEPDQATANTTSGSRFSATLFVCSALLFFGTLLAFFALLHTNHFQPQAAQASGGYLSWPVFDGGKDDPGTNYNEAYLTTANVSGLRLFWQSATPAVADDSVAYQADVNVGGTYENLVFVNTIKGNLVAYNALSGTKVWEADPSSADFNGQGTKSSPAVDPSGNYVYAYAVDGYIHRYNIASGTEATGGSFPAQITLLPNNIEKGSSSINIANGYLYMTTSGNDGDYGHYGGHVVAVNLSSGAKTVWNAECSNITTLETDVSASPNYCSNTQSGIWARPGVKVDPVTGNVYVSTGNGLYNASTGGHDWGDSIVELSPNLSTMIDSYTPTTYSSLDSGDADVGSSAPVILPTVGGSSTPYMMVQVGKDGELKLLNRANLSGAGGPGHVGGQMQEISFGNEVHEQPAIWLDGSGNIWVFVTDEGGNLSAYKLVTTSGTSRLSLVYSRGIGVSSSPFVANGVIYLDGGNIMALNATTGATLFNSSSIGVSLNQHWEAPVVINGVLYTPDYNGHIDALYLPGVTPTFAPTGSAGGSSGGTSGSTGKTSSTKKSSAAANTSTAVSTAKPAAATTAVTTTKTTSSKAATSATTALTLTINNAAGRPVNKAKVTLNNGATTFTNGQGKATFSGLQPGGYTATVTASGSKPYTISVTLTADRTKSLNIKLASATSGSTMLLASVAIIVVVLGGFSYIWFFHMHFRLPWRTRDNPPPPTVITPQS